jgi:hypothetical protein
MDNDVNKQHCCARNNGRALLWLWHGDIKGLGMNLSVGSGDQSGADVCIWLWTPFGWKTEFVSGNCVSCVRELVEFGRKHASLYHKR